MAWSRKRKTVVGIVIALVTVLLVTVLVLTQLPGNRSPSENAINDLVSVAPRVARPVREVSQLVTGGSSITDEERLSYYLGGLTRVKNVPLLPKYKSQNITSPVRLRDFEVPVLWSHEDQGKVGVAAPYRDANNPVGVILPETPPCFRDVSVATSHKNAHLHVYHQLTLENLARVGVILCDKPRVHTWIMEDALEPGVHYVLDEEGAMAWINTHESECERISAAATAHSQTFLDHGVNLLLRSKLLKLYASRAKFVTGWEVDLTEEYRLKFYEKTLLPRPDGLSYEEAKHEAVYASWSKLPTTVKKRLPLEDDPNLPGVVTTYRAKGVASTIIRGPPPKKVLDKVQFREKKPLPVWRGKSSKNQLRMCLVDTWISRYGQFGFTTDDVKIPENYLCAPLTPDQILEFKYVLSVEGDGPCENLPWLLRSNSVVLMAAPTMSSWFLEERLRPFVHYVPLSSDFSDLEEMLEWCKTHDSDCEQISRNATHFMSHFREMYDEELEVRVLRSFFNRCIQ